MFPYSTMLEPLFWIIMGFLYTLFVFGLRYWAQDLKIKMDWWKWLLFTIWFIGLNIVIAGGFTLIGENETRAGLYFLGVFGVLFIILGAGVWKILKLNNE